MSNVNNEEFDPDIGLFSRHIGGTDSGIAQNHIRGLADLPQDEVGKEAKKVWDDIPKGTEAAARAQNPVTNVLSGGFFGWRNNKRVRRAKSVGAKVRKAEQSGAVGREKAKRSLGPIFGVAAVAICGVILFGTCSNNGSSSMSIGMPDFGQIGNVPGNVADGLLAQIPIPAIGDEAQQRINAEAAADAEAKRIADREQAIKDNKWNQMWADFMNNPFYRNITWCAREWCQNPLLQYQNRLGEHREISSFAFDGSEYKILLFPDFRMALARMYYSDTENPHMFEMTDFSQIVSYLKQAGALESVNVDSIKDRLQLQIARQILKSKMGLPIERDGVHVVFDPLRKTYVQGTIPPEVKGDDYAIIRFLLREGKPGTVSDYAFARGLIGANERLPLPLDATWTVVTKETVLAHAQENQMYEFFTEKRGWFTHAALNTPYFFAMLDGAIGDGNPEFGIRPFGSGTPGSYVPGYTLSGNGAENPNVPPACPIVVFCSNGLCDTIEQKRISEAELLSRSCAIPQVPQAIAPVCPVITSCDEQSATCATDRGNFSRVNLEDIGCFNWTLGAVENYETQLSQMQRGGLSGTWTRQK